MAIFKCKMCGAPLEVDGTQSIVTCDYCDVRQTIPKLDDERRANLYDRANHFRRNNDFDKAMGIYENILNEDNTDAEAYWSLVLCRYGIEYVEDPATRKRVPTVNRAQFTSIFDDEDYKSAIANADGYQREIYETEANAINEIQKGILAISQKEEPFDVFVCYKETDASGRRTQDSVLATEFYHELTREGFKVFFSRITLEDKLGVAYEPYIFAALHSAKVMVVLGTRPEHFDAAWVKNEWSRFLALIKNGAKKTLIPAYRDMDPYDLPEEFSHLQAQDMSKLGFMQDLTRGIKKIVDADAPKQTAKETFVATAAVPNVAPLLKRAFMFLEDGDFNRADEFCEQVLNQDPENAQAYLGKLMAELCVKQQAALVNCAETFDSNKNYEKAVRFADAKLASELKGYNATIKDRNARKAEEVRKEALYLKAMDDYKSYDVIRLQEAIKLFTSLVGYKDSDERIRLCQTKIDQIRIKQESERIESERKDEVDRKNKEIKSRRKKTIKKIVVPIISILLLGSLFLLSYNFSYFENIKQISTGGHTVGLRNDGTVVAVGLNYNGQCDVKEWKDIVAVSSGGFHTVGLKKDGTVVAVGSNDDGECNVYDWKNIVSVSAGSYFTVGLTEDGTVVATGNNRFDQCNVDDWNNIVSISAQGGMVVGLKSDGTVVSTEVSDIDKWENIVAISTSGTHVVGLKSDGTVIATGNNRFGQCNVDDWKNIVAISTGSYHTIGLKDDGTVIAVGDNIVGQCDVTGWKDIIAISAGDYCTVGLKEDGTCVAIGNNSGCQCHVGRWRNPFLTLIHMLSS